MQEHKPRPWTVHVNVNSSIANATGPPAIDVNLSVYSFTAIRTIISSIHYLVFPFSLLPFSFFFSQCVILETYYIRTCVYIKPLAGFSF